MKRRLNPLSIINRDRPSLVSGTALMAGTLLFSAGSLASIDDATVQKLIAQVEMLNARVQELESADETLRTENVALREATTENAKVAQESAKASAGLSEKLAWAERIKLKGDFRYRYENIDDDTKDDDRDRQRIRARIEANSQVTDTWKVGFGLASGGEDPVSTNQTLGDGGSTKGINLDLAYFDWTGLENTHVLGGKYKNPFYRPAKNALIWDGDYRPEGIAFQYDNGFLFSNGAVMMLESDNDSGDEDTITSWGLQFGINTALSDTFQLITGVSYYNTPVSGEPLQFDPDDSFGNSTIVNADGDLEYAYDFESLELFAELRTTVADLPASVFVDWVENQDPDDDNTGWAIGAKLGKAKKRGTWQLGYTYQDLDADAVLGLTTDSDFGGGGTNVKGSLIKAAYALDTNVSFAVAYFINDKGDDETDYDRLQVDLKYKY